MKITSAEFIKSAVWPPQYPLATLPEIAFVGRSKVGSSLISTLIRLKNLAKTSNNSGLMQFIIKFSMKNS
jgi:GTP-binding protein